MVIPLPLSLSPKLQPYDVIAPSPSEELVPLNEQESPEHETVNEAVGGLLEGGVLPPVLRLNSSTFGEPEPAPVTTPAVPLLTTWLRTVPGELFGDTCSTSAATPATCGVAIDVPLIVYVPERFRHLAPAGYGPGRALDQLVSLLDLGPTTLSVAGIRPPSVMQGRAFMGPHAAPPRQWLHAGRDRMDERIDLSRAIGDGRYLYIRNFRPDRRQGEYLAYMFETPTTQVWKAWHDAGRLTPAQDAFWSEKAPEELYDLAADPDAVRNLAGEPAQAATLGRMREALREHLRETGDLGLLPEVDMHRRRGTRVPYALSRDAGAYPVDRVLAAADRASLREAANAGLHLSVRELLNTLAGVGETVLLYHDGGKGRPRAQRMLTDMDATQQRLADLFSIQRYAPTR